MSAVEGVSVHRVAGSLSAAQNWARHISKFRAPLSVRADTLPVRPLTSLLLAHGVSTVDLLVLDVEGAETTVLRSLDLSRVRVRLLAIETVDAAARQLLRHHGFRDTGFRAALGDAFWVHERYFHEKFGRGGSDGHIIGGGGGGTEYTDTRASDCNSSSCKQLFLFPFRRVVRLLTRLVMGGGSRS